MGARERNHAAEWMVAAGELFRGRLEQAREGRLSIGRGVMEDGEEPLAGPLKIGLRGLAIERFLAAERIVERGGTDPHRGYQLIERRALIAALPEQLHRLVQRLGAGKHRRTCPAAYCLAEPPSTYLPCNYDCRSC